MLCPTRYLDRKAWFYCSVLGGALFHETFSSRRDNSMVLIQDVDFASTSEQTLLPFFGRCHIAYVPR